MNLQIDAARELAATLNKLADIAEQSWRRPAGIESRVAQTRRSVRIRWFV